MKQPNNRDRKSILWSSFFRFNIFVASTVILGLLLLIFSILEIKGTRHELLHTMNEEGQATIASIEKSISNAIQAFDLVESLLAEKLLSNARLIERLDYIGQITEEELVKIAEKNDIYRINIFDEYGNRVLSNSSLPPNKRPPKAPTRLIKILEDNQNDEMLLGFKQGRFGTGQRFAVAIVLNIDAKQMLEFRKTIGAGKLMRDIGASRGVLYVILQDSTNVLMASEGVSEVEAITADAFLQKAVAADTAISRLTTFNNQESFEIVKSVYLNNTFYGLLRIGLSTQHLREAERNARRRAIVVSLLLLVIGVVVVNTAIGAQNYRNLQNAYKRIETYTGKILERMTDAVVAVNQAGDITLFNRAAEALFGISADQALNQSCHSAVSPLCPLLTEAIANKKPIKNKEINLSINGKELVLSINVSLVYSQDHKIDTAFAVIKDLTQQKQLEENLKRKDRLTAMGHLASGVAHEIRNPLNAISMIAQRFLKEFEPASDAEEYQKLASTMVSETRRINDIIQQFLMFARPPKLQKSHLQVEAIVNSVATLIRHEADDKGIHIDVDCSPLPPIFADRDKLQQALLNIARNSIQACSTGDTIVMSCRGNEDTIEIKISDNGKGMEKDILDKIFNIYFTTKEDGTGLGLSIVQQIISQHNGTIDVKSKPGQGTTFTIHLPIGV